MERGIWINRKGERLKISEMTGEHIKNCIAMIENSKKIEDGLMSVNDVDYIVDYDTYKPYLRVFRAELASREKRLKRSVRRLVNSVMQPYVRKRRFDLLVCVIERGVIGGLAVNYILSWFGRDMLSIGDAILGVLFCQFAVPVALIGFILDIFGAF